MRKPWRNPSPWANALYTAVGLGTAVAIAVYGGGFWFWLAAMTLVVVWALVIPTLVSWLWDRYFAKPS